MSLLICPHNGLNEYRKDMWVEFVVGSLPCSERFFSGYSGFLLSLTSPQKPTFSNSSSTRNLVDEEPLCGCGGAGGCLGGSERNIFLASLPLPLQTPMPAPWVHMKPRWPSVPVSARSWRSYEKVLDCEQSKEVKVRS